MTTILIWLGSGFAFGSGLLAGLALLPWLNRKTADKNASIQDESLVALQERNAIGWRQVAAMEELSATIKVADSCINLLIKFSSK